MSRKKSLPLTIVKSIAYLKKYLPPYLMSSRTSVTKFMRIDRQQNLQKILIFLIKHLDIRSRKLVRYVKDDTYSLVTVGYIAKSLNMCERTVWRCLGDLVETDLLEVSKQPKAIKVSEVSLFVGVVRKISKSFFKYIGLLQVYEEDLKYALSKPLIKFLRPVKKVMLSLKTSLNSFFDNQPRTQKQKSIVQQLEELQAWNKKNE